MLRSRVVILAGALVIAGAVATQARSRGDSDGEPRAEAAAVEGSERPLRFNRVKLDTGVELAVVESGPVEGQPVLFLHGLSDSWFSFSPILDHLPATIRAIVPSQRGHGDSERPECCYRIDDFARDAMALLDALGIERADVVAHSMGSFIAQRIAIDYPQRVQRLVLLGSGVTSVIPAVAEFSKAVKDLEDPVPAAFAREFQASTAHEPLPADLLDRFVAESQKLPAHAWRKSVAGLLEKSAADELPRIQASTLVVIGRHDAFFDLQQQEQLVRALPNARSIVYDHVAHAPHWEDPQRFARDLAAFLTADAATARRELDTHGHGGHAHGTGTGPMPLLTGLGDWHHEITTRSPQAQQYFDQGLRLTYAFNHDEAVRSFERAVEIDSTCAMCYWGIAYALGPNINLPMDAAIEPRALAAIRRATRLKRGVAAVESALIDALAVRYAEPAGADRTARDSAYANALRLVARRFPESADAQVLFADAMMNLRPWNQWTRAGEPQPGTTEVVAALERVMQRYENHAGACHFYVHAVEASPTPERALPCAERLPRLMPGAGHVVHMPAHIYLRVGRYEDAARANIAAVEADANYFAKHDVTPGVYPLFYAPHNLHFLWASYLLSGQRAKALGAARALTERVPADAAREAVSLQGFLPSAILTFARFGDWSAVLAEPAPPADLLYVRGIWHYARGLARAQQGELRAAQLELDSVRAVARQVKDDMIIIMNPAPAVLNIAGEVLAGAIATKQNRLDAAIAHFRNAVRIEDGLTYDEPPPWYHSARNLLGEALLQARRFNEAETVFREDLWFVRETGWSLSGLERALRAQGKREEAKAVAERLQQAWKYADSPHAPR